MGIVMENVERQIELLCGTCGNNMFEILDSNHKDLFDMPDNSEVKCSYCGRIYTKDELLQDNEGLINSNINDVILEFTRNLENELKRVFK